jgi:hypothetical protein
MDRRWLRSEEAVAPARIVRNRASFVRNRASFSAGGAGGEASACGGGASLGSASPGCPPGDAARPAGPLRGGAP